MRVGDDKVCQWVGWGEVNSGLSKGSLEITNNMFEKMFSNFFANMFEIALKINFENMYL